MMMAAVLAQNGHFDEALTLSDVALASIEAEDSTRRQGATVNRSDVIAFQETIRAEMQALPSADTTDRVD